MNEMLECLSQIFNGTVLCFVVSKNATSRCPSEVEMVMDWHIKKAGAFGSSHI